MCLLVVKRCLLSQGSCVLLYIVLHVAGAEVLGFFVLGVSHLIRPPYLLSDGWLPS